MGGGHLDKTNMAATNLNYAHKITFSRDKNTITVSAPMFLGMSSHVRCPQLIMAKHSSYIIYQQGGGLGLVESHAIYIGLIQGYERANMG